MTVGTKSVLFGIHQFMLHPIFVLMGWSALYGINKTVQEKGLVWFLKLLVCIVVHDWGYIGKPNMDGEEGKLHPALGEKIAEYLFGKEFGELTGCHSKSYAKLTERKPSKLCWADKLAFCVQPFWMYNLMAGATKECDEYIMNLINAAKNKPDDALLNSISEDILSFLNTDQKTNAIKLWHCYVKYKTIEECIINAPI